MTHIATRFSDLNLSRHIASALDKIGYDTPTPIQQQAIPEILLGRDIQGIAQTGTGKTAAFALPILSHIADDPIEAPKRSTRVLILSPTRELASQIGENIKNYARHIDSFKSTVIFGGTSMSKQVRKVVPGNDVITATPGRLLDLIEQKILHLNAVEYLILDEADQMMDMGFIHTLKKIIPLLPEKRQTLFFSATMPKSIAQLAAKFLTNPVKIAVTPESTTAERVSQSITYATRTEKQNLLAIKLLDPSVERALVFTRTKHGADRVVKRLASVGLDSRAIHGNKSQGQRTRALTAFKDGEVKFLIATDVAARGIDIRGVSHVFNFEIPNVPEQYIHRIGRTGRAGEAGIAISFVAPDEKAYLKDIQKILKQSLEVQPLPEDFAEQSKALKKRPALVKAPEPEPQPRRRKDRKSRPSRHRKGPAKDMGQIEEALAGQETTPRRRTKPNPNKPSRAERKRSKSGSPHKPRREEPSAERSPSTRRQSGTQNEQSGQPHKDKARKAKPRRDEAQKDGKPVQFKRKPRSGRKPAPNRAREERPNQTANKSNNQNRSQSKSKPQGKAQEKLKGSDQGRNQGNTQGNSRGKSQGKSQGNSQGNSQGKTAGGGWSSPKRRIGKPNKLRR